MGVEPVVFQCRAPVGVGGSQGYIVTLALLSLVVPRWAWAGGKMEIPS
jgi:hypothetical protein